MTEEMIFHRVETVLQSIVQQVSADEHASAIVDSVVKSKAHFKNQQIGEPDLLPEERKRIAAELLSRNPALFLQRFGVYIPRELLLYFDMYKADYAVQHHLQELSSAGPSCERKNLKRKKNRRYEAMRKLVKNGDYFSDVEMRKRHPNLYQQMIGKYQSNEERQELDMEEAQMDHVDRFSQFLMSRIEKDMTVGSDSDSNSSAEEEIEDEERDGLRKEFIDQMYSNFLSGKDDFDYSAVDNNSDYDDINKLNQDHQDKYFDESESVSSSMRSGSKAGSKEELNGEHMDCNEAELEFDYMAEVEHFT